MLKKRCLLSYFLLLFSRKRRKSYPVLLITAFFNSDIKTCKLSVPTSVVLMEIANCFFDLSSFWMFHYALPYPLSLFSSQTLKRDWTWGSCNKICLLNHPQSMQLFCRRSWRLASSQIASCFIYEMSKQ